MVWATLGQVPVLAVTTPGDVLAYLQRWTPVALALAGLTGTAVALAVAAYNKASKAAAALERIAATVSSVTTQDRRRQKRISVAVTPSETIPGNSAASPIATSPGEGVTQ